jgi:AcrR family transcriptional regulator
MAADSTQKTKAELTRERLLKLALREFNRKGFEKVGMRDLAKAADLSLGAFYYHFRSKDEIVHVYYAETLEIFEAGARKIFTETRSFEERLERVLEHRLATFQENREVLIALSQVASDPRSELSPFGEGTREIRVAATRVFEELVQGSDLKVHRELQPILPTLLWMVMMGSVLFWVFDASPDQRRTFTLIRNATPLMTRLLRLTGQPIASRFVRPWIDLLKEYVQIPT